MRGIFGKKGMAFIICMCLLFACFATACGSWHIEPENGGTPNKPSVTEPGDDNQNGGSDKDDNQGGGTDSDNQGDKEPEYGDYVKQTEIPTLCITAPPITSKYDYVAASIKIESENGDYDFPETQAQIRLRGNFTRSMDKKPYRIKFDTKQSPMGLTAAKSWYLLNEATDYSLMRNYLGYTYADSLMDYYMQARYVHVSINGDYRGIYLLTDKRDNGLDVSAKKGGFLVELDNRAIGGDNPANTTPYEYCLTEGIEFGVNAFYADFAGSVQAVVISDPSDEDLTPEVFASIYESVTEMALNLTYSSAIGGVLDLSSAARYYMVKELWHDTDVGSVFLYRDTASDKINMGPVWDLDLTCGISGLALGNKLNIPTEWFYNDINAVIKPLWSKTVFRTALKQEWNAAYENQTADLVAGIDDVIKFVSKYQQLNFDKWDTIGKGIVIDGSTIRPEFMSQSYFALKTWQQHAEQVKTFLTTRAEWMNTQINKF